MKKHLWAIYFIGDANEKEGFCSWCNQNRAEVFLTKESAREHLKEFVKEWSLDNIKEFKIVKIGVIK